MLKARAALSENCGGQRVPDKEQLDVVLPALVLSEDELKAEQEKLASQQHTESTTEAREAGPAEDP